LFNKRIVPYDVYFTLGAGSTALELSLESQASTFHVGAGQIFAFSRNAAFRWDIRANIFSAQAKEGSAKATSQNVIMTLGFSYFLPEVSRR
jgi:outer membrane beta-barrel protein